MGLWWIQALFLLSAQGWGGSVSPGCCSGGLLGTIPCPPKSSLWSRPVWRRKKGETQKISQARCKWGPSEHCRAGVPELDHPSSDLRGLREWPTSFHVWFYLPTHHFFSSFSCSMGCLCISHLYHEHFWMLIALIPALKQEETPSIFTLTQGSFLATVCKWRHKTASRPLFC